MTYRIEKGRIAKAVLSLLFYCSHRHLTRPFTPVRIQGMPQGETYVVCLDCAKQFAYDWNEMRIGEVIDPTHDACVIPSEYSKPRKDRLAYALGVAVPVAILVGAAVKAKKRTSET